MLKKAIASDIFPATRLCKCGRTVSIKPIDDKTYCDKCGELVYEDVKVASGDKSAEQADPGEHLSGGQSCPAT